MSQTEHSHRKSETVLTIIMPCYNKVRYVAEALESVFSQRTDYAYEILIADDCSTDGTLDVVARYEKAHPGCIRVLRSACNQKLFRNVVRAYALTRTPYFCVLDPDDWWSDPDHLQRALDFLESHRDFTVYAANSLMRGDGPDRPLVAVDREVDGTFGDFLRGRCILGQTAGVVYRNVVFARGLPAQLTSALRTDQEKTFRGDAFRNLIHLHEGKVHFVPACAAVYRITEDGLWQGVSALQRELGNVLLLLNMDEYFSRRYDGLAAMADRLYRGVTARLPELLSAEKDIEAVRRLMVEYRALGDRLTAEVGQDRADGLLPPGRRLACKVSRWIGRLGQRGI